MRPRWFALLALMGAGGCSYWYTVTVPASDTTAPVALNTLYYDSGHQIAGSSSGGGFSTTWADPYKGFFVVGSGMDSGGTHRVDLSVSIGNNCRKGSVGQNIGPPLVVPLTEIQPGSVGSSVNNGLYGAQYIRFADMSNPCSPGWTWVATTVHISATARDFHGNTASVSSTVTHHR